MAESIVAASEVLFDDFGTCRRFGGQLAKLDFKVHLSSAVGRDPAGDEILATLAAGRVHTDMVAPPSRRDG